MKFLDSGGVVMGYVFKLDTIKLRRYQTQPWPSDASPPNKQALVVRGK